MTTVEISGSQWQMKSLLPRWRASLQTRILVTYGAVLLLGLALVLVQASRMIYRAEVEQAEHNLEIQAFLAANAIEDPLSGFASEFEEYERWEQEHDKEDDKEDDKEESNKDFDDEAEDDSEDEARRQEPLPPDQRGNQTIAFTPYSLRDETAPQFAQRLHQVALSYAADTGARVTILTPAGDAVADSGFPAMAVPNQLGFTEIQTAMQGKEQHDVRLDPLSGELTVFVAAPIRQSNTLLGFVQFSQPLATISANGRLLISRLIMTGLAALVLATGLGLVIGQRIVQPVRRLESAARAVTAGDFSQNVPVESEDELGALARAFNQMVAEVQRMLTQQRAFVANASHELRTPLANIKLRSEALLAGGRDDPDIAVRYLQEIDSEADRLARLANTLLDIARLERDEASLKPPEVPYEIGPVVEKILGIMQPRAERAGLSMTSTIGSLTPVHVWPEQLEAILVNLLDNAVKYTPVGGEIQLSSALVPGYLQLRIKDSGPGIPTVDIPFVFDRFYRADKARSRQSGDEAGSGAGLGLAIVKRLVEQNSGRIHLVTRPGEGTTFTVEFPLAEDTATS